MSALDDRKAEIAKYGERHPDSYYGRLIHLAGSVDAAARFDLAMDGDTYWADLRKRPFAGDEELKALYREMARVVRTYREAAMQRLWDRE